MAAADRSIATDEQPFVGRAREIALLRSLLADASASTGGVVLITGEPGIGKTRIVEQVVRALPADRAVVWGRCYDSDGTPAYWPWRQALRRYASMVSAARLSREVGPDADELARLLPPLRSHGALVSGPAPDPDEPRLLLFEAVAAFLRRAGASQPLVVVLDDLHWADRETLLLLHFLARELAGSRVVILATLRDTEMRQTTAVRRMLTDLLRSCRRVPLDGLSVDDVASLLGAIGGTATARALATAVHDATDGNPFFVGEVAHLLGDEGLAGASLPGDFRMPDSVIDVVGRRLDPLPAAVIDLLSVAAVIGRHFDLGVLATAAGLDAGVALETLAAACALGVIEETAHVGGFSFSHALIRDALLRRLPPAQVPALHAKVAEAIEARFGVANDAVLGELARHWFAAATLGHGEKAVDYAARAAENAIAHLGYDEAAGHYERALCVGGVPSERRLRLLISFGETQRMAGDEEGARATFLEAAQLAKALTLPRVRAMAVLLCGATRGETGGIDITLVNLIDEALADLDPDAIELRASLLALQARALYFTAEAERREAASLAALALARRSGVSAVVLGAVLTARHFVLWAPGRVDERLALAEEALAVSADSGRWDLVCEVYAWRVLDFFERGDMAAVDRELLRYRAAAERVRMARAQWHVGLGYAARALVAGNLADAERLAGEAAAMRTPTPYNNVEQFLMVQRFAIREEQGRLAELDGTLTPSTVRGWPPIWRTAEAMLHLACDRRELARSVLYELAARGFDDLPRDGMWIATICRVAELCALLDQPPLARLLLPRLAPFAAQWGVMGLGVVSQGCVARYVGLLALTAGELETAVMYFEQALAANRAQGAQIQLGHASVELARALDLRKGPADASRATALRNEAAALAERLDLVLLQRRLHDAAPITVAGPRRAAGPRRRAALQHEGDVWTVSCEHEIVRLRDSKGLGYLRQLLVSPGRQFHVFDLVGADGAGSDAGMMLDDEARRHYRHRLREIQEELDENDVCNNVGRVAQLRDEKDALTSELARGFGLSGRARRAGSDAERARLNVTRALRSVLRKIEIECPVIGSHLERRVVTGTFCQYDPDPGFPVTWDC